MTLNVRCENLSAGWSGSKLIEQLSLGIDFEELNCALPITGRTGIGKSTLLYAMAGMAQPMDGRILWQFPEQSGQAAWSSEESPFSASNSIVRRHRFGFLLQDASMIQCFTVAENLRHILRLRGATDDLEARVERAVRSMLIGDETPQDFLPKFPVKLSGGMRQRMALAAAIAHDPAVLFADEPTASLDDQSGLEVLRAVRRWLDDRKGERAFVFVTHRVETLHDGLRAPKQLALQLRRDRSGPRISAAWHGVGRPAEQTVQNEP